MPEYITNYMKENEGNSLDEGYARGNMFTALYKPYKNYTYQLLMPKSKKEEALYNIMALDFAINDLNLHLDLYPTDTEMLKKYRSYVEKLLKKEMEYVQNYGPLEVTEVNSLEKFNWIDNPWPWEDMGGNKYV